MKGRLRVGETVGLLGAICLLVSLFLPWYSAPIGNLTFWETFGPAAALMLAALCAALAMVVAALSERESPALPVSTAVWCVLLGLIGLISAIVRVLERPDNASSLCAGPWVGLVGVIGILAGAWYVLRDERPERYLPANPAPRPRP
jgi:uncharacterized membrane protein HdeD (DUF308 family)